MYRFVLIGWAIYPIGYWQELKVGIVVSLVALGQDGCYIQRR